MIFDDMDNVVFYDETFKKNSRIPTTNKDTEWWSRFVSYLSQIKKDDGCSFWPEDQARRREYIEIIGIDVEIVSELDDVAVNVRNGEKAMYLNFRSDIGTGTYRLIIKATSRDDADWLYSILSMTI